MEQIKKVVMIKPEEGADTHLEAHKNINSAITQFYGLLDNIILEINSFSENQKDAEDRSIASFSKLKEGINSLKKEMDSISKSIDCINSRLDQGRKFFTKNYEGIVDTDKDTVVELDSITDLVGSYLVNIVVNDESINQGVASYSFPKTSLANGEYTPRITLVAKEGEHAVLEYNFTIILTEL